MLNNITEFKDYCLRKLGAPVIKINLDDTQIIDAIEDAILKFNMYHIDGYEEYFYLYEIPAPTPPETQPSRVIQVPPELLIDKVVSVVSGGGVSFGGRFDTYAWQAGAEITSPGGGGWANIQLQDFTMMQERLGSLNAVLGEVYPFAYNKSTKKITLKFSVSVGEKFAFHAYRNNDPRIEGYENSWNDPWLKAYATALIKERWGNVLSKVSNVKLVGGIELNGRDILDSAKTEIRELEEQLKAEHQSPIPIIIG